MKILMFRVLSSFKIITKDKFFRVLYMGTLFFGLQSINAKAYSIALLDTAFCPHLIKHEANIQIAAVMDLTQSTQYQCKKSKLNNRQYHGHWVLSEILNHLKTKDKIIITPMIIFNKYGQQKFEYWKRAVKTIKSGSYDLVVAAAGLPIIDNRDRNKVAELAQLDLPIFLAAGRAGIGIKKDSILFPHDFYPQESTTIFGSYHQGVQSDKPHFKDESLINSKSVDYFIPYNYRPRLFGELKGTSLALAIGTRYFLNHCLDKSPSKNCLQKNTKALSLSNGKELETVSGLNLTEK